MGEEEPKGKESDELNVTFLWNIKKACTSIRFDP
jgi:hypothetical protein